MESSARFVAAPLLRHLAAAEFSENRVRLFADSVDPINTYAVVGVVVFRDLEHIVRSAVMKLHGQRIRREDVVGDVTWCCRLGRKESYALLQDGKGNARAA